MIPASRPAAASEIFCTARFQTRRASSPVSRPQRAARAAMALSEASASPAFLSVPSPLRTLRASRNVGSFPPKAMAGPLRRGPTSTEAEAPFPSTLIRESPPTPMESVARAGTSVLRPPRHMPPRSMTGDPWTKSAMSVVVPPMSKSRAHPSARSPARAITPMTLAAGPERMDCTGSLRDTPMGTAPPSTFRRKTGALMPRSLRTPSTASRNSLCRRAEAAL